MIRLLHLSLLSVLLAAPLAAQGPVGDPQRALASRAELEATAAALARLTSDSAARARAEVLDRLQNGDFGDGERVLVRVRPDAGISDTFTVRSGRLLELPGLPPLSLQGVLRHEFAATVKAHVSKFVRDPAVDAIPLVRLSVVGAVARPGFYTVPASVSLGDAIMAAGGYMPAANANKTTVLRVEQVLLDARQVRVAAARGASIDQLNLHGGDQIMVRERTGGGSLATIGLVSGLIGTAAIVFATLR